jgi:hypothetical protein
MKPRSIFYRVLASVLILAVLGWAVTAFSIPAHLSAGEIGAAQFANSDQGYVYAQVWITAFRNGHAVLTIIAALFLVAVWWKPVRRLLIAALSALALITTAPTARAYYDKTDYIEVYFILPNESAFFVPDVGANKDTQSSFGSVEYLNANKIPAKRFQVPHAKLPGSAYFSDYYVPTGRLIIVDRTPFNREWVAKSSRGTSPKDESFPCQSSEGIDVTVGISISAFVTEQNAATFLYWFGVNPPQGDRGKPEVIFTSVFYGKSLAQVMDGVGRGKVQSLVCNEIAGRPLDKVNSDATKIMEAIQAKTESYLASRGITLDYIGWADTFTFDEKVQDAINRRYVADREKEIAAVLGPVTGTVQALATAEATRTIANKWNGATPSSVSLWWLPSGFSEWLAGMLKK